MQYSIYINQPKALEWGLNIQQATLFSFCYELPSWADEKVIGGQAYYWISKSYVTQRVPILTDKPDTVKRLFKQLEDLGLIERRVVDKTKLFIRVTKKGRGWNEHNDGKLEVGKKIPGGREKNPHLPGEKNPPNTNTINTNTINTKKKAQKRTSPSYSAEFESFWSGYPLKKGKLKAYQEFNKLSTTDQEEAIEGAVKYASHLEQLKKVRARGEDVLVPAFKYAQGWITGRRWEDVLELPETAQNANKAVSSHILEDKFGNEAWGVNADGSF